MTLNAEQLLAGSSLTHTVEIPAVYLSSNGNGNGNSNGNVGEADAHIELRPLTVRSLQRIAKAARDDEELSAALMIREALVEPALELNQVQELPAGLARFLLERVNEISGIDTPRGALEELVQAPLARACFVLAREFGWTPEEASGLTVGQMLLYVEMARGHKDDG